MRFDLTESGFSPAIVALAPHREKDSTLIPVRLVSDDVHQQRCFLEDDAARVAASMDLVIRLSRNLRCYLGDRRAYCVDRPWVLAEYTIYAAVLLTLSRERRLHQSEVDWAKLTAHDLIKPVLLPVSTELEGQRIAGSQGIHLFGSSHGYLEVQPMMEILCAGQHTTVAATRHALSRLLLAVPATVTLSPAMCELFARAQTALAQRPIRGVRLVNHSEKKANLYLGAKSSSNIFPEIQKVEDKFETRPSHAYKGDMPKDEKNQRANVSVEQRFAITDGVNLTFTKNQSPFSPSRMEQALTGRQSVRSSLFGVPSEAPPEHKSPFSTKKILQIMMGKLPNPSGFD